MKLYVIEMLGDYTYQLGCSLNKNIAQTKLKKIQNKCKTKWEKDKYWISEYDIDEKHYTEFDIN